MRKCRIHNYHMTKMAMGDSCDICAGVYPAPMPAPKLASKPLDSPYDLRGRELEVWLRSHPRVKVQCTYTLIRGTWVLHYDPVRGLRADSDEVKDFELWDCFGFTGKCRV